MIPFVENCFKHGTSDILESPWLSLQIGLADKKMAMKLLNGKSPRHERDRWPAAASRQPGTAVSGRIPTTASQRSGIGISNVRKRLELIYPDKHELSITDDPDVFIVNLKIELKKILHARSQ